MEPPLSSVSSADWYVYHDWIIDQLAMGKAIVRFPVYIKMIADILKQYEERKETPLLFLAPGSGLPCWGRMPEVYDTGWAWEQKTTPVRYKAYEIVDDRPENARATNPAINHWLERNHPQSCWDFFGTLIFLAISGRRA